MAFPLSHMAFQVFTKNRRKEAPADRLLICPELAEGLLIAD